MYGIKEKTKGFYEELKKNGEISNIMESPKLVKVVVSAGIGRFKNDKRKVEVVADRLAKITGQKAAPVPARKSIASFKLRAGEVVGYKVTLRGDRMNYFVDKLINIAIPRTKDFRGIPLNAVDEMGNLTIGIKEHIIFPETGDEELSDIFGLSITLVSNLSDKEKATAFFKGIGVPFKNK